MFRSVIIAIAIASASTAVAQSSLGIKGTQLHLGATQDETGNSQVNAGIVVDVAIAEHYGLQGDLNFYDTEGGLVGQISTHLYMTPQWGQRYGVFASYSDIDGRAMSWGSAGIEGMVAISDETTVEGRVGLGFGDDGLDYIFGGISAAHAFSDVLEIEATIDILEIDELGISAISHDVGVKMTYSPNGSPWGVYASATHSGLSGSDSTSADVRLGLGFTMTFGESGGTNTRSRPFRSLDPVAQIARRGLW